MSMPDEYPQPLTVADLVRALILLDQTALILSSSDEEGNSYRLLYTEPELVDARDLDDMNIEGHPSNYSGHPLVII